MNSAPGLGDATVTDALLFDSYVSSDSDEDTINNEEKSIQALSETVMWSKENAARLVDVLKRHSNSHSITRVVVADPTSNLIIREYMHASHFEVRFRYTLRR